MGLSISVRFSAVCFIVTKHIAEEGYIRIHHHKPSIRIINVYVTDRKTHYDSEHYIRHKCITAVHSGVYLTAKNYLIGYSCHYLLVLATYVSVSQIASTDTMCNYMYLRAYMRLIIIISDAMMQYEQ